MPSQQYGASNEMGAPRGQQPRVPTCPVCQRRMSVKLIEPVLFASGLDDVTYACESCGTETKRSIKRS